jgi:phosphoglycerate dehydrogenase-like enzyme
MSATASELGVWVAHVPSDVSGNAVSVAEHAVFLAMAVSRHLHLAAAALAAGKIATPAGCTLFGKTACIIGLGNIGSRLAQRLHAFGVKLVGVSPESVQIEGVSLDESYLPADLATAVRSADYVFICASGAKQNRSLIDREILSAMKPGSFVVNVARGGMVDPAALLDALQSGHLAGAGLDVFADEPVNPDAPLLKHPNVVATPHIGGMTDLSMKQTLAVLRRDLDAYASGDRFHGLVNDPGHGRVSPYGVAPRRCASQTLLFACLRACRSRAHDSSFGEAHRNRASQAFTTMNSRTCASRAHNPPFDATT